MFDAETIALAPATAESCTGGLVAAALTAVAGSSDVVDRGFVAYSNKATLTAGAVSRAGVDLAVSVTGIAGPGGGTADKPISLIYLGVATKGGLRSEHHVFPGNRADICRAATTRALEMLKDAAG